MRSIIRCPADKGNLAPRALATVKVVLDIKDGIAATNALLAAAVLALGVEQLLAEDVKVCLLRCLLDNDLFPVVADLVDYPLDVLAELELIEGANALGRDGDTAGLVSTRGTGLGRGVGWPSWWWTWWTWRRWDAWAHMSGSDSCPCCVYLSRSTYPD